MWWYACTHTIPSSSATTFFLVFSGSLCALYNGFLASSSASSSTFRTNTSLWVYKERGGGEINGGVKLEVKWRE